MAQKQLEERMKSTEREVIGLKEILGIKDSVDCLAKEMKRSMVSRRKEESGTSDVLVCKTKEKREELEMPSTAKPRSVDKSKYKKLEMSIFNGVNLEF